MFDILKLLQCLLPEIKVTTMRQLSQIIMAMLAMSGRVRILGISRWTLSGGSYRTVIRFFQTVIPLATVFILLAQIFAKLTSLGRIHNASTTVEPS